MGEEGSPSKVRYPERINQGVSVGKIPRSLLIVWPRTANRMFTFTIASYPWLELSVLIVCNYPVFFLYPTFFTFISIYRGCCFTLSTAFSFGTVTLYLGLLGALLSHKGWYFVTLLISGSFSSPLLFKSHSAFLSGWIAFQNTPAFVCSIEGTQ